MNSISISFKNISPRLMGYIAGFMWILYTFQDAFDFYKSYFEEYFNSFYFEEMSMSIAKTELITVAISCVISLIIGVGLIKNHPKIIIGGIICSIADGLIYFYQLLSDGNTDFIAIVINTVPVFSLALILLSLVSFKKVAAKVSLCIIGAINIIMPSCLFMYLTYGIYIEDITDFITDILFTLDSVGFSNSFLFISLALYAFVLVTYEGKDRYDEFNEQAVKAEAYLNIKSHMLRCFFFGPIWYFIWVYRTTKAINEISGEYEKYKPGKALLLLLVPFYSYFWVFGQSERLGDALEKQGAEERDMGITAVLLHFLHSFAAPIYMQYKINEYCMISTKKLKKKAKYDDYYDENYGITIDYPTDTTEKKPTEVFLKDSPWDEYEE